MEHTPYLIDTTLREGLQRYGLYLDLQQKRELLLGIAALGVEELEIGSVGRDPDLIPLLGTARQKLDQGQRIALWARCREQDVRVAAGLKPDCLCLCIPVSGQHIRERLHTDPPGILRCIARTLGLARELGLPFISLGLEDASRARTDFLLEVVAVAQRWGAQRIRISDTVGVWNPLAVSHLVARLRNSCDLHIGVHCHNDFGMAAANSITALLSGADCADASLLGLGERAGLAPLEEVLAYLHFHAGQHRYDVSALAPLCHRAAALSGKQHSAYKPVTGEQVFYTETGLHIDAQYKSPQLYDPFPPSALGHERRMDLGAKTGLGALAGKLEELGLVCHGDREHLVSRVRLLSLEKQRPLDLDDLQALAMEERSDPRPGPPQKCHPHSQDRI